MVNRPNTPFFAFVLATLLAVGNLYLMSEPGESREVLDLSPVALDSEAFPLAFAEQDSNSDVILAQKNCGNETCSDQQCCCLNIDTGAQCCRPLGNSSNCVEACKKSKPC